MASATDRGHKTGIICKYRTSFAIFIFPLDEPCEGDPGGQSVARVQGVDHFRDVFRNHFRNPSSTIDRGHMPLMGMLRILSIKTAPCCGIHDVFPIKKPLRICSLFLESER